MKILIVEDLPQNIASAEQTLSGHDLVIESSYISALKRLRGGEQFDVVLSDLMMLAEDYCVSGTPDKWQGKEAAPGMMILMAALFAGVRYIGLCTFGGHHAGVEHAMLDFLGGDKGKVHQVGKSLVSIHSYSPWIFPDDIPASERQITDRRKDWGSTLQIILWLERNPDDSRNFFDIWHGIKKGDIDF